MRKQSLNWLVIFGLIMMTRVIQASQDTIGPNGINSKGLTTADGQPLNGSGVAIGQVEITRPGLRGFDTNANSNSTITPAAVFLRDGNAVPNNDIVNDHAERVAGIMVSTDQLTYTGVAPQALLFASAYGLPGTDSDILLTIQKIASQSGMRAINPSWGEPLKPGGMTDGNSQVTLGIDWSASRYDVLHVVAGSEGHSIPIPSDNFNGITVSAATITDDGTLVYRKVASFNTFDEDAVGDRTSIDLLAPGDFIEVTGLNDVAARPSGTSYAAPHVTATVALLQQYAQQRITVSAPHWNADAQHHQVMKAVLMNSADKIKDDGTFTLPGQTSPVPVGGFLGMERTVLMQNGTSTWFDSPAADKSPAGGVIPVDLQMGAGALNAKRALQQFSPGEFHSGGSVPVIGWDFGHSAATGAVNKYAFNHQLLGGSFVSITLAFDRNVMFANDVNSNGQYDAGDTFAPSTDIQVPGHDQFSDLDLYLLPKGSTNKNQAIALSETGSSTIEHIFFQVPATNQYEFWVRQSNNNGGPVDYGVAWWALGTGGCHYYVGRFQF
jgi:hypothetical protein